jgi:hypothetical protein
MYKTVLAVALLVLSATPTWSRGVAGHATMHRLGSNLRHHHATTPAADAAIPGNGHVSVASR